MEGGAARPALTEDGPVPQGSAPVRPSSLSALPPSSPLASQRFLKCSQQAHTQLSLFFFPFWARLSASRADELFRAHQRPWGFMSLGEYSSFKSSEVINAKGKQANESDMFSSKQHKKEGQEEDRNYHKRF